jgi:hypothetical protein
MLNKLPTPEDKGLISFSSQIQEVLAPVKLDKEKDLLFENTFFPARRANKLGIKAEEYSIFMNELVEVSLELNNMIRIISYIVSNGGRFEDVEPEDFESILRSRVITMQGALNKTEKEEILRAFLSSASNGQYHVVKDSERFKGGKDIVFSGVPLKSSDDSQTGSGVTISLSSYESSISTTPGGFYDNIKAEHYQSMPAFSALAAMDEITQLLFKKALSVETANKWEQVQLPTDFDFTRLDKIFARNLGFDLGIFSKHSFSKVLSANFSILLMIPPTKSIVAEYTRYLNRAAYNEQNEIEKDNEKPIHSEIITEEANKIGRQFGVSMAMNLPKDYVDYISQNTEGALNNFCLSSWITQWSKIYLRAKGSRTASGTRGMYASLPRYIIPASKNDILLKYRKDNNMPVDPGRINEDRISVSPRGTLNFMPRTEDDEFNNAQEYQDVLEKALTASYAAGAPLTDSITMVSKVFATSLDDTKVEASVAAQKKQLEKFKGTLLALNWDYNVILTAGSGSPFTQLSTDLNGSTSPSPLAIADYLGYDFSDEGERKQSKSFVQSLNYMIPGRDFSDLDKAQTGVDESDISSISGANTTFLHNGTFLKLLKTYTFLVRKEQARGLQELLDESMKDLGYKTFSESKLDVAIYKTMSESGKLKSEPKGDEHAIIKAILIETLSDCSGDPGTNLYKIVGEEVGYENAGVEVSEHQSYFNQNFSSMADFGNVYTYVGGLLFKKVCEEITKANPSALLKPLDTYDEELGGYSMPFVDISKSVMPLAYMFAKYVPGAMDIFEKAEAEAETYQIDEDIDISDIQMPGIAPGSQVFPHQIKAHKFLRRKPKHAVLDIHPGGGKTITVILDIGNVVRESSVKIIPLVICPDKLVANWCEDTAKITKGSWNTVPITSESFKSWGEEKLRDLVLNAPPNTIFCTGLNFLKSNKQQISFGPKKMKLFGGAEFIKSLGFNYIALDESHKAKQFDPQSGKTSAVHTVVKQVFTGHSVLYTRLATGTLIHGVLQDVVGQAALFSSHIFRTPNDFNQDAEAPDGAMRVRSKFGEHASVITIKRKEWAFMLPSPIDTFIDINLQDALDTRNDTLMQVYNALLQQTIEDLEAHVKAKAASANEDEDEDDGNTFEGAEQDLDMDDDDELSQVDPNVFKYYMQRLEQMLTDPWGDEAFQDAARIAKIDKDFTSPKVLEVFNRLDRHFSVEKNDPEATGNRIVKWEQGIQVKELSVVEHNGTHYMRRRMESDEASFKRNLTPPSNITPDKDGDTWKIEMQGKVLIFCRYTRSTDAIFNALPARYKSVARKFHGQAENKWQQIEDFKTDPDVKILVANEQAIIEGHNLQMASRIIRVETPWSPGDYEQSTARIFRPDPAAAKVENGKPGDMRREVIYIDWLMSAGTMEVAKVARLMWKTMEKTKFDEKGNSLYDPVMDIQLEKIKMDVKTLTRATTHGFESFQDHFTAKSILNSIETKEFHDMRKTTLSTMQDLPIVEPLSTFRRLDSVPILENQRIPDPDGFGLERFVDWYGTWVDKNFDTDPAALDGFVEEDIQKLLKGLPVKTEFGTGVIVKARINWTTRSDGTKVIDHKLPVSMVKVRYNSNDEIGSVNPRKLFVASKVSGAIFDKFFSTNKPWSTESERKNIEKEVLAKEKVLAKKKEAEEKRNKRVSTKVAQEKSVKEKALKRKENASRGKPVNDGVVTKRIKSQPVDDGKTNVVNKEGEVVPDMKVTIIPTVFNGFLALHVNATDPDAKALKQLGFKAFGGYAFAEFKTYKHFEKALDYVESKFNLDNPTLKRLSVANDTFDDFSRMGFNMKQASKVQGDLPNFFRTRHRESNDKKTVKIYPVVLADRVRLTIDLDTSPLMKRHIGKTMQGSGPGGKWKLHEGMSIFFAINKANAKAKIRDLIKAGYEVTNIDRALKLIGDIQLIRSKEHNKEIKDQAE